MKMDIGRSWSFLERLLSVEPRSCSDMVQWEAVLPSQELKEAVLFLGTPGMCQLLEEWLYEKLLHDLSTRVGPAFWKHFDDGGNSDDAEGNAVIFCTAFGYLYDVYSQHHMVVLKRFRWLKQLAASAPVTAPMSSAFTPVRGGKMFTTGRDIKFEEASMAKGSSTSFGGTKGEKRNGRAEMGRSSVTFEKGTKEGDDQETNRANHQFSCDDAVEMISEKKQLNMDDSYSQQTNTAEHSLLSDSSLSSLLPDQNVNTSESAGPLPSHVLEDDDFETFIRSPIGGTKKLTTHGRIKQTPAAVSGLFSSVGSVSVRRGTSLTSTPGDAIKETPGPITPIVHRNTLEISSDVSMEDSLAHQETPIIVQSAPGVVAEDTVETLPDASAVFGSNVSSRPVPGGTVRWPSSAENKVQMMLRAVLFYSLPKQFAEIVKDFYTQAFHLYKNQPDDTASEERLKDSRRRFDDLNKKMDEMGLMELVSGAAVTEIVHSQIEKHIEDECKGNFDTFYLSKLEEWLDQQVLGWLKHIYACKQTAPQLASVGAFRDRLRHFIYETYARSLIGQFFDIIIDYPDSKPAISDLSACLEKTDLRSELVSILKHALENRLLHPGVNTADILTAYIAAIKSLRLLEPAGVILELVCEPVGRYLRSREDTVRCIVASLTDEGNNELISELVNTKPGGDKSLEEDGNMCGWEDWVPDPVDADTSTVSKNRRSADILSTLVNIYGSKELFVNEYRALLADRILMQYNYDVERELRYLELLKLRFGEAQLHFCEVMLRDVTESRRVNARIQDAKRNSHNTQINQDFEMNAMILSAQFWPAFRDEKIKLPTELQEYLDKYTKSFETHKQNRTLLWKPHLGMMNIELELRDETLSFSVSPVHAAIIMKFQTKSNWSIDELSTELEMTASVLRRKIAFWQGQGLLREISPDVYHLVEERRGRPHDLIMVDDEEIESAMASAQQQKEEEMQVFWTYIQGMLSNLNCLTLERIHSMLRMFAMEEPSSSEVTIQELKTFLDNKVKDQVLIFSGGVYRQNK